MSLQRLRTFIEVYRQRSISGAARSLNLTQPAVSQHIAGLEVAIGRQLFERLVRGVAPTAAADELAQDIGDKLDGAEAALASARARSIDMTGTIQIIGHGDFMAEVLMPGLLPLLQAGMRVRMQSADRVMLQDMLVEGHCDLGISAVPITDRRLRTEVIRTERTLAVAAPAVAARILGAADLTDALSQEPVLGYNLEQFLVEQWLAKNKLDVPPVAPALIGQDLRALRGMIINGFGWTVMPEYLCRRHIDSGELVEIPAPLAVPVNTYFLVWAPSVLRGPRIAYARQTILWYLQGRKV